MIRLAMTVIGLLCISVGGASAMVDKNNKIAIFAGGCFWCMEKPFDKTSGVLSTTSGYIGGHVNNPTYEQVSGGRSGHVEALKVVYDPALVNYDQLLDVFWRNIDPLDGGGQFCDRGEQYRSAIFYTDNDQQKAAEESKKKIANKLNAAVATDVIIGSEFFPAEEYHQDYYSKNPIRYTFYRSRCGRDKRLEELWGDKE